MKINKKVILSIIILIIGGSLFYFLYLSEWLKYEFYENQYDKETKQRPVNTNYEIVKVLKSLKAFKYSELDKKYLSYTLSSEPKFRILLQEKIYYQIKGKDIFKFLVGHFRIKDFLSKDIYYSENLDNLNLNKTQYLLIDINLLFKLLELQNELQKKGYNPNGFKINYAHRHPLINKDVGGASVSYHIQGKAIDIEVMDINNDGLINQNDKKIVNIILENKVINNLGGIGLYPWSMTLHFDVRGYKARWDRQ